MHYNVYWKTECYDSCKMTDIIKKTCKVLDMDSDDWNEKDQFDFRFKKVDEEYIKYEDGMDIEEFNILFYCCKHYQSVEFFGANGPWLVYGSKIEIPEGIVTVVIPETFEVKGQINFPDSVRNIHIGYLTNENKRFIFPEKIKHLHIDCYINLKTNLENLKSLEYLFISNDFIDDDQFLHHLPNTLKHLYVHYHYGELDFLPESIETLALNCEHNKKLHNLPISIKKIHIYSELKCDIRHENIQLKLDIENILKLPNLKYLDCPEHLKNKFQKYKVPDGVEIDFTQEDFKC